MRRVRQQISEEELSRALTDSELLSTLLETTPDYVYFKDKERRFVRVSKSFERLLGCPESEIIGRRDEDLFPPDIATATVQDDEAVIRTGKPIINKLEGGEVERGKQAWVLTTKTPWRHPSGATRGVCGISREFTDMKLLRDSQRRAEQVIAQIHDSVISTDLDGFITSWNKGSEVLLGYTEAEMLGKHISTIYPPEEHEFLKKGIIEPLLREGEHHVQVRLLRASGDAFFGHLSLSVLKEEGQPVGMIGYTMDITQRVQVEQRQKLLMKELDHRVKNTLAMVRSLARESANQVDRLDQFLEAFAGRLNAMTSAHEALAGNHWSGVAMRQTVEEALGSHPRLDITGPDITLRPEAALPLCLALHELATNARKHGALKSPEGRVLLHWTHQGVHTSLSWEEIGGASVERPLRPGFGLTLVRGLIEHELGGSFILEPDRSGVAVQISLEHVV